MSKQKWLFPLVVFSILMGAVKASAHGSNIQYRRIEAVEIEATYDNGTPMKEAQVVIYAPNDPATPWLRGKTDSQGKFSFVPDRDQTGNWDVKVRQSGHGDIISIPFEQNKEVATQPANAAANSAGYTPLQKAVMAAVGVWGFVGTALFFTKSKQTHSPTSLDPEPSSDGVSLPKGGVSSTRKQSS